MNEYKTLPSADTPAHSVAPDHPRAAPAESPLPRRRLSSWDRTRQIMQCIETHLDDGLGALGEAVAREDPREALPAMSSLRIAARQGIDYLLRQQRADGHWEEYELPVGPSDAWVTAYVGLALASLAQNLDRQDAFRAAYRAAEWLIAHRPFAAGWGYSDLSGPDADSTAYVLMLLAATGHRPEERDITWLLQHVRDCGGFATYLQSDAWGNAHPDVTPTAFSALAPERRTALIPRLIEYVERMRQRDGTFLAYWWRACHYSTYCNLRMLRDLGRPPEKAPPRVTLTETQAVHTSFDLAFVTGIAHLKLGMHPVTLALSGVLLESQADDGKWPGGASLRLTNPNCADPWNASLGRGRLYVDTEGFITTASAVHVLNSILSP